MSLIPVPGRVDLLVSVMGLFPPFIGQEAGVYRHQRQGESWEVTKMLSLPFAHRCEILHKGGVNYLFTSTVSRNKREPSDWSRPGEVFLTILSHHPCEPVWEAERVFSDLFRNHGMLKTVRAGEEVLCISGAEGIFTLSPGQASEVTIDRLFDREVSEFAFIDINGDGVDELVTIEPFHGDCLNVYRLSSGSWERIYDAPLSFGHGLSAGWLAGRPVIVAGSRRGEASLDMWHAGGKAEGAIERLCIEPETGTTQTQLFHHAGRDYILSANQLKSEVALYYLK